MNKLKFLVLNFGFTFFALHFMLSIVFAQVVSSSELINHAQQYDGKTVEYIGEAIGEIMMRGEYAWINVLDKRGAIGVFCSSNLLSEIKYVGSFHFKGDKVKVKGVFHRACPQHGGDMDIHAQELSVVEEGAKLIHPIELAKVKIGIILAAGIFLSLIFRKRGQAHFLRK